MLFSEITDFVDDELALLSLKNIFKAWYLFTLLATKHSAFREEQEWRVLHSDTLVEALGADNMLPAYHPGLTVQTKSIRGLPQDVMIADLNELSASGVIGLGKTELTDEIIVGPTDHPATVHGVFVKALAALGFQDAQHRVRASLIPLRHTD